jgi:cardiolipin synthase
MAKRNIKKLLEDINNATHHIHIEYYIFDHDETGMEIAKALVEKASEGVLVRFIYDDFGSNNIGDIPEILENGNVEVIPFDPLWMKLYTNANYRNHRKNSGDRWDNWICGRYQCFK